MKLEISKPQSFVDLGSVLEFYTARLPYKYPHFMMKEILSPEKHSTIHKAGEIYDRYVKQFSNKRWQYTRVERFWIVVFAKSRGIGNTRAPSTRRREGKSFQ